MRWEKEERGRFDKDVERKWREEGGEREARKMR
jgi:hypothetical protein